jgi:hypothetical protein
MLTVNEAFIAQTWRMKDEAKAKVVIDNRSFQWKASLEDFTGSGKTRPLILPPP